MTLGQAAVVLVLVFVFCLIQIPRAAQQLIQSAPDLAPNEAGLFPSTELLAGRARYFKIEFHERQLRALIRLDRLDALLTDLNASPESLRDVFGRALSRGSPRNSPVATPSACSCRAREMPDALPELGRTQLPS